MIIHVIWLELGLSVRWTGRSPGTGLPTSQGDFTNSYTIPGHGRLQGTDRAVTTCCLPLNRGIPSYLQVLVYPSTTPVHKETTYTPSVPDPMDRQVKDIGKPKGTTNRRPDLTLLLLIQVYECLSSKLNMFGEPAKCYNNG
jgi:hypothetical protein